MITSVIKTITRTAKNTTENGVQGSATRIDAKYIIRGRIPGHSQEMKSHREWR
jgi:hypothetical protein